MHQVIMQPNIALWHWREKRLTEAQVMSHTGCGSVAELFEAAQDALNNESMARELMTMTAEEHEIDELREAAWERCGDYLRECGPPSEQVEQEARIMEAIRQERQWLHAAAVAKFRRQ